MELDGRGSEGSRGYGKQEFGCNGEVWSAGITRRQQGSAAVQNPLMMPQSKPECYVFFGQEQQLMFLHGLECGREQQIAEELWLW